MLKRRRCVKQPISYAEPSLRSKLRRGYVFFQKKDEEDTSMVGRPSVIGSNLASLPPPTSTTDQGSITMLKRRRCVKQPISYAEPSLRSKLRRGYVFFQKKDEEDTSMVGRPSVIF